MFDGHSSLNHGIFEVIPDALSPAECQVIKTVAGQLPVSAGMIPGDTVAERHRKSQVRWLAMNKSTEAIYNRLAQIIARSNDATWRFEITKFSAPLQFTEYDEQGSHYTWHMDWGPSANRERKLSLSIQLSDASDYDGGDLEFMNGGVKEEERHLMRSIGTAILFPSFIQHRVTPILRGSRKSLVAWVGGQPYR